METHDTELLTGGRALEEEARRNQDWKEQVDIFVLHFKFLFLFSVFFLPSLFSFFIFSFCSMLL